MPRRRWGWHSPGDPSVGSDITRMMCQHLHEKWLRVGGTRKERGLKPLVWREAWKEHACFRLFQYDVWQTAAQAATLGTLPPHPQSGVRHHQDVSAPPWKVAAGGGDSERERTETTCSEASHDGFQFFFLLQLLLWSRWNHQSQVVRAQKDQQKRSAEKTAHRKCCGEVGPILPLCNYYFHCFYQKNAN